MAFDAANNSHPPRSRFKKSVSLQDWWLTKPQTDDGRNTVGVSGLICGIRAERCFNSAPIVNAYDIFELETVDGVCVNLQGYINKEKTLENGFSSEVFDHFVIGFPVYWEDFSTSCLERGFSDVCVLRDTSPAHEEGKDSIEGDGNFDDMNTRLEDKVLNIKASSSPHDESIMKPGDEIVSERPPLTSEIEDKNLKKDDSKFLRSRMTRSMTKMEISPKDKDKNESQIDTMTKPPKAESSDPLRTTSNKKRDTAEGAPAKQGITSVTGTISKRKLKFEGSECKMDKTPTTTGTSANKGPTERYVLSPESLSGKRSRSGRVLLPSLEFWRSQTVVYDVGLERQVTGVREVAQSSKDTSEDLKSSKKKGKRR